MAAWGRGSGEEGRHTRMRWRPGVDAGARRGESECEASSARAESGWETAAVAGEEQAARAAVSGGA